MKTYTKEEVLKKSVEYFDGDEFKKVVDACRFFYKKDPLAQTILNKLVETYELAAEITQDNPNNHFNTFQGLLRDFKNWDLKILSPIMTLN
jgi:hypothetical protein